MIISMCDYSKLIVVTNRKLCKSDFLEQLKKILRLKPLALILREKDLAYVEYKELAIKVIELCAKENVEFYIHSYVELAQELGCNIHLSYEAFRGRREAVLNLKKDEKIKISVSCHSIEEAKCVEMLGGDQIVLGTIFNTSCKPGKQGVGLEFLKTVCDSCNIPIFAIGGIKLKNIDAVLRSGAAGGCMMSEFMEM